MFQDPNNASATDRRMGGRLITADLIACGKNAHLVAKGWTEEHEGAGIVCLQLD